MVGVRSQEAMFGFFSFLFALVWAPAAFSLLLPHTLGMSIRQSTATPVSASRRDALA